ncbi:sulfite exporter TauE/SafE family protein [Streptomyces sp. NPDC050538]|uniref:sulfite exporter TauE/SafE family protein n=1 Tax=Streptomyces sp. NPDC050538 TaxID=3365627 RepID=UPI00379C0633
MIALVIAASLLIGAGLGVLGGGGSILTVPVLVYLAGMETKEAIATSLFVVGVTSAAGVVPHARAGRVRWRTGLMFGVAGMSGAYAGGRLAAFVPGTVLLLLFALMMIATAVVMIRGRRKPQRIRHELPVGPVLLNGVAVGLVTGLVGAGGGFLIVPALALFGGLPMSVAAATSLQVIALQSFAGFAGHLSGVHIDWALAAVVTSTAVVGSLVGGRLAGRIPQDALRRAFGWFVAAMGVFVLAQQIPPGVRDTLVTNPWVWSMTVATAGALFSWYVLRRSGRTRDRADDASGPAVEEDGRPYPHPSHQDTTSSHATRSPLDT